MAEAATTGFGVALAGLRRAGMSTPWSKTCRREPQSLAAITAAVWADATQSVPSDRREPLAQEGLQRDADAQTGAEARARLQAQARVVTARESWALRELTAAPRHAAPVPGRARRPHRRQQGAGANGRQPFARRGSSTAASTTAATPSPRGRSPAAFSSSTSPGSWARRSLRSTPPTGTCCPTRRSTCAGCSIASTELPRLAQRGEACRETIEHLMCLVALWPSLVSGLVLGPFEPRIRRRQPSRSDPDPDPLLKPGG